MSIRQRIAQWFYSPGAYGLWVALDNPDDWTVGDHTAVYRQGAEDPHTFKQKCVATMWIASGAFFFDGYADRGTPKFLGKFERHLLWRKFMKLNNRKMLFRFTRLEDPR